MSEPYDVTTPADVAQGIRRFSDRTGRTWTEAVRPPDPEPRFRLITDIGGAYYVIPEGREDEWGAWREADADEPDGLDPPEWAVRVGDSPCEFRFPSFTVWGKTYP